jgi:hypothetical protein
MLVSIVFIPPFMTIAVIIAHQSYNFSRAGTITYTVRKPMNAAMSLELIQPMKALATAVNPAAMLAYGIVRLLVFGQVAALTKRLVTAREVTLQRPFFCVCAQMHCC